MTFERFREYVGEAMGQHISRDDLVPGDLEWENDNFTRTLASKLRQEGLRIDRESVALPRRDLSEFEGR